MQKLTVGAGLLVLALAYAQPAAAQLRPVHPGPMALPAYEVMDIVRSEGFRPLQGPERRGPVYWVRAIDPSGYQVRVVVNAYMGRIVAVVPVGSHYATPIPPYARPPAAVPAPYGANPRETWSDDFDDDTVQSIPRVGPDGRPLPPNPSAKPRASTGTTQAPLPRPRPKVAEVETSSPAAAASPPAPAMGSGNRAAVKPAAPAAPAAKPSASPTDGTAAKPAPHEE